MPQHSSEDEAHFVISKAVQDQSVAQDCYKRKTYFFPRQLRGPKEKGWNMDLLSEAYGSLSGPESHRSGWNSSGSLKLAADR